MGVDNLAERYCEKCGHRLFITERANATGTGGEHVFCPVDCPGCPRCDIEKRPESGHLKMRADTVTYPYTRSEPFE